MIIDRVRDLRQRVRALQGTDFACAAAATVDAVGDLLNWNPQQLLNEQAFLIDQLQLGTKGTSLADVQRVASARYPNLHFDVGAVTFDGCIKWAASGAIGVVIRLAPPTGTGIGHAVHLIAGDSPVIGPLPGDVMDDLFEVQLFDPWYGPERFDEVVRRRELRRRYEAQGRSALVVVPPHLLSEWTQVALGDREHLGR